MAEPDDWAEARAHALITRILGLHGGGGR